MKRPKAKIKDYKLAGTAMIMAMLVSVCVSILDRILPRN